MKLFSDKQKKLLPFTGNQGFLLGGSALGLIVTAGLLFCVIICFSKAGAEESHAEALVRYYVDIASEVFHKRDIRQAKRPFGLTVVVRRFTLDSDSDTLQLDTAVLRAYMTPNSLAFSKLDSLSPDSVVVLRSSFLDDKPELPSMFAQPAWLGEFVYSLFPNDPGAGGISVSYDSLAAEGGLSIGGSSGIFTVDRSTGELHYSTLLIRSENRASRYSRETEYGIVEGYSVPLKIKEQFSEIGIWGNRYEIRETIFLNLKFIDSQ